MSHVLVVPAFKLGNPMMLCVQMESDDGLVHGLPATLTSKLPGAQHVPRSGILLRRDRAERNVRRQMPSTEFHRALWTAPERLT